MNRLVEALGRAKQGGDFNEMTSIIPYARWLGISAAHVGGELLGKLSYSDMAIGNPSLPALHGGTIGALLESIAIFQLLWEAETLVMPKTITITIDYLRSGKPVDTFAKGVVTKHGRRVVNVRADAWQDDRGKPIASANVHFLILPVDEAG